MLGSQSVRWCHVLIVTHSDRGRSNASGGRAGHIPHPSNSGEVDLRNPRSWLVSLRLSRVDV